MLQKLPPPTELETKEVLKLANKANNAIGELKGICRTIPNEKILINLLVLQEAQYSSEIENIVTTTDDLYISKVDKKVITSNIKEVRNYEKALLFGFETVKKDKMLTNRTIIKMQQILRETTQKFRTQSGTTLKNDFGEVIYAPPQEKNEILDLMSNLEKFINDDELSNIDPLIKMAIIHHQFESIHPFYDGNGRVGRIINILYLCLKGYLDYPILYLSRYIINTKKEYYSLLQQVRENEKTWQDWITYILNGVTYTSLEKMHTISVIKDLMQEFKTTIRKKYPKMYSQDLINALFKYPYTRIEFLSKDLQITRITATKYLDNLVKEDFLVKITKGRNNYYFNQKLIDAAKKSARETYEMFYQKGKDKK